MLARGRAGNARCLAVLGGWATVISLGVALSVFAAQAQAVTFTPGADAFTTSSDPSQNFGDTSVLKADSSPRSRGFLKFNVRSLSGPVTRATLKVYARRDAASPGLRLRPVSSDDWREDRLTHRNAPAVEDRVSESGAFEAGEWVSLDATKLVRERGRTVSMAVATKSGGARRVASREDAEHAPRLEVEQADQLQGVQLHPLWGSTSVEDFDRELDLAKSAGADTVRIDIGWSSLEWRGKGQFSSSYVEKADTFFRHARDRGLEVIATLWSTPCWASSAPSSERQDCAGDWWDRDVEEYPPRDPDDYADVAEWVAERWGDQLRALEVWNEPNLSSFMDVPDQAAAYAPLLKRAYPRIKAADPGITVLGGAFADSDGDFLKELYAEGIKGSYDAISYHPYQSSYNGSLDPDKTEITDDIAYVFQPGTEWVRDIMVAHGDRSVGLWATELGSSTCEIGSSHRCVTESQQAEYTKDYFRIARQWPYVKSVIAYSLRDAGTDDRDPPDMFGLLERDFSEKPAYDALKDVLSD